MEHLAHKLAIANTLSKIEKCRFKMVIIEAKSTYMKERTSMGELAFVDV